MTYADPHVLAYIQEHLVPYAASMADRAAVPLFRANHVIWTPSTGLADHKGQIHYLLPGFTPPAEFLAALRIGRARGLRAGTRHAEAVQEREAATAVANALTPEALFWRAAACYLTQRTTTRMYALWAELCQ